MDEPKPPIGANLEDVGNFGCSGYFTSSTGFSGWTGGLDYVRGGKDDCTLDSICLGFLSSSSSDNIILSSTGSFFFSRPI